MSIDKKIKSELEGNLDNFDEITADNEGVSDLIVGSFKGGLKNWVIAANVITMLVTIVMLWVGYRFFTTEVIQQQLFWGICTILAVFTQVALKQWLWMEMNRSSLMREIKRVEIAVTKLAESCNK